VPGETLEKAQHRCINFNNIPVQNLGLGTGESNSITYLNFYNILIQDLGLGVGESKCVIALFTACNLAVSGSGPSAKARIEG